MIAVPLYVAARATLLDALTALDEQRAALVLVGAQANYLHPGAADVAVAEHTADADLVVNPRGKLKAARLYGREPGRSRRQYRCRPTRGMSTWKLARRQPATRSRP